MRKIFTRVIIGSALVLALSLNSYAAGQGTTAASFLKIGVGARASAMGDAFTAIADDATALYWNPAGLIKIKERQLSATYNVGLAETGQGYAGIGYPSEKGVLGGAINYVSMGNIEGTDENGNPTGSFAASDFSLSLGYAKELGESYFITKRGPTHYRFMVGLSGGMIQDTIAGDLKIAFLASLGGLYEASKASESFTLGVVLQNLGTNLGSDSLPFIIKGGLAFKRGALTLAMDIAKPSDNNMYFCTGVEWWLKDIIALRAGYKTNQDIGSGFTAGIGFKKDKIQLDYAYVPYGELGGTHRVSLGMRF